MHMDLDAHTVATLATRPLMLGVNPVSNFYYGGRLWRTFRRMSDASDSLLAEDWVGSCIPARHPAPDGSQQGVSTVAAPGGVEVPLPDVIRAAPGLMLGPSGAAREHAVQVKLVSPRDRVPVHTHPDAAFAAAHCSSACGKAEAWILMETSGPAYAGIGFREGVSPATFRAAVEAQDVDALLNMLHRTELTPGDVVYVAPGIPHYISGGTFFIEVQEPSDLGFIAEWDGHLSADDAFGGLDLELALSCFDFRPRSREYAIGSAFQAQVIAGEGDGWQEVNLMGPEARRFFGATRVRVDTSYTPPDARYYVGIVTGGRGRLRGDGWEQPIRAGETFVCGAALAHQFVADGPEPLQLVRATGPDGAIVY